MSSPGGTDPKPIEESEVAGLPGSDEAGSAAVEVGIDPKDAAGAVPAKTESDDERREKLKREEEESKRAELNTKVESLVLGLANLDNQLLAGNIDAAISAFMSVKSSFADIKQFITLNVLSDASIKRYESEVNRAETSLATQIETKVTRVLEGTDLKTLEAFKRDDFDKWKNRFIPAQVHEQKIETKINELKRLEAEKTFQQTISAEVGGLIRKVNILKLNEIITKLKQLNNYLSSQHERDFLNSQISSIQLAVTNEFRTVIGKRSPKIEDVEAALNTARSGGAISDPQGELGTMLEAWRSAENAEKDRKKDEAGKNLVRQAKEKEIDIKTLRSKLKAAKFTEDEIDNLVAEVEPVARSFQSDLVAGLETQINRAKAMVYEPRYKDLNTDQIVAELKKEFPDLNDKQIDVLRAKVSKEVNDRKSLKVRVDNTPAAGASVTFRLDKMAAEIYGNTKLPQEIREIFKQDLAAYKDLVEQFNNEFKGLKSVDLISQEIASKQVEVYKAQLAELEAKQIEILLKHAAAWGKALAPGLLLIGGGIAAHGALLPWLASTGTATGLAGFLATGAIVGGGVGIALNLTFGKDLKHAQTEVKQIELEILNNKKEFRGHMDEQEKQKKLEGTKEAKKKLQMRVQELKLKAHRFVAERGGKLETVFENMKKLAGLDQVDGMLEDLDLLGNIALGRAQAS